MSVIRCRECFLEWLLEDFDMRLTQWKFLGLIVFVALLSLRCAAPTRLPSIERLTEVEVEGASPLIITVADIEKRPLRTDELSPPSTAGFFWEYRVRITNPSDIGYRLDRLRLTVQNLWGKSWPGDQPLNFRVKEGGEEEVVVRARLASSSPEDTPSLTGIEALTFLGQRDDGQPIIFTVRVPLE
jgi:hypothetical protein